MKDVQYKKHWSYSGSAVKSRSPLADFVLDVMYLMGRGVIPPLHVLNEVLRQGGDNGGMGPGTSWKPFEVTEEEYNEMVSVLLTMDVQEARKRHPYLFSDQIVEDEELGKCLNHITWLGEVAKKYG